MTHGKVAQSLEMGIGQRGKALSSEDQPCEELESALAAGLADASVVPGVGQPDQQRLAFQSAKSGKKAHEFPSVGCARCCASMRTAVDRKSVVSGKNGAVRVDQ